MQITFCLLRRNLPPFHFSSSPPCHLYIYTVTNTGMGRLYAYIVSWGYNRGQDPHCVCGILGVRIHHIIPQALVLLSCHHSPALAWADSVMKQCRATGQLVPPSSLTSWARVCGTISPTQALKVTASSGAAVADIICACRSLIDECC